MNLLSFFFSTWGGLIAFLVIKELYKSQLTPL
jgi:hypothetical protein